MSEAELLASIVETCKWLGLRCYHTHDSRRSVAGFPDLVIVGRHVAFVELKANSRISKAQQAWLDALAAAGAWVYVWRPEHWPDQIMEALNEIGTRSICRSCDVRKGLRTRPRDGGRG